MGREGDCDLLVRGYFLLGRQCCQAPISSVHASFVAYSHLPVCESILGLHEEFQVGLGDLVCGFQNHPSTMAIIHGVEFSLDRVLRHIHLLYWIGNVSVNS